MSSDNNPGTSELPLKTISKAAFIALAGDTVLVHEGVYREWVSPANTGITKDRRIVYMAKEGNKVVIKGSEVISSWKKQKQNLWMAEIPNSFFGNFNPYAVNLCGDWLFKGDQLHLGEVYINGHALLEVLNKEALKENNGCPIIH